MSQADQTATDDSDTAGTGGTGRSHVSHQQHQQRRNDYWTRIETVRTTVSKCARALERGQRKHYAYVCRQMTDTLVPLLLTTPGLDPLDVDGELSDHDGWDFDSLEDYLDAPQAFQHAVYSGETTARTGTEANARATVYNAFHALAALAEHEEIIKERLLTRVDAVGFTTKLGEHLQDAEMDIGDPVRVVDERSGALKTLFTGGTGQGKSCGLEAEAEDYYRMNFQPGRDMKLIDLVGLRDGENWFYDIPQHDDELRRIRREHGLPEAFDEDDNDDVEPSMEILVPLTPGLASRELPYDTESERFSVRPFTVPASAIRKPLLVSMIVTQLTPQQETIVRDAYDEVDRRSDDWMLSDLAEEIRSRDELAPDKKKPVIRTLRQLQGHGFIRTREDEWTIDWRDIFEDSDTITVFSQAFIEDDIAKLIVFGYLVHTIVKNRETMFDVPECVLLMRELWKVAPHQRRQNFDSRAAALQEAIGHMLSEAFRENRHGGIHVLADTQQPSDLLKPVREMFNRYVIFNTNQDTVRDIFEWTANDKWRSFYNTLSMRPGEASVVGMVEPAIEERDIEFVGPIQYVGPSHHHRIERVDLTGWHARCNYLDREELRRPGDVGVRWDDDVPTKLLIDTDNRTDDAPDVHTEPVQAFASKCLRYESGKAVIKDRVYAAFNEFIHDHDRDGWEFDQSVKTRFGTRLKDAIDGDLRNTKRERQNAWLNLTLTRAGEQYADRALEGLEDAAEPITD